MPRRNEGKTQTIQKRLVRVYFPTREDVERWNKAAGKAPTSRFLREMAERGLRQATGSASSPWERDPTKALERRILALEGQLGETKEQLEVYKQAYRRVSQEARQLRKRPSFPTRPGRRRFLPGLLPILVERVVVQDRDLFRDLEVAPSSPEAAQLIQDLELLERGGLVERTGNGWRLKARLAPLAATPR